MNLILQHWNGSSNSLVQQSTENIREYAHRIGADYKLLTGKPYDPELSNECQKLMVLSPWEKYDQVAILDTDMFALPGLQKSLFSYRGVGVSHKKTKRNLLNRLPDLTDKDYPVFGGSVIKLSKLYRNILRSHLNHDEVLLFDSERSMGQDEGILHRLFQLAHLKPPGLNKKWALSSWDNRCADAYMIHVRRRTSKRGPRQSKLSNLQDLQEEGIL